MLAIEIKKIIRPLIILIALLISGVFYYIQLSFLYEMLPNGCMIESYKYAQKWHDTYGVSMTDEDFQQVQEDYETLVKQANALIVSSDYGKERGLTSVTDLEAWFESLPDGSIEELNKKDRKERLAYGNFIQNHIFAKIQSYQWIKEGLTRFSSEENFFHERKSSDKQRSLIKQVVLEEESWRNILPENLSSTVASHTANILLLSLVLMALLLPAPFVRDNLLKLKSLQWTSKKGRSLVRTQYMATQIVSFSILTIALLVFLAPLLRTEFARYFDSGLNSFLTEAWSDAEYSFLHVTFGQWILLLVVLVYLIGLSFSSVLFVIAQKSDNYLSMIMKTIPLLTVYIMIGNLVIKHAFYIQNFFYKKTEIMNSELYVAISIFVLGLAIGLANVLKSQKKELVEG